uniref:F-box domain-containing protein n=1 Tax=Moniliophthora roreri TaxID=221103 RepID=A0A0W0FY09_MONRR
MNTYVQSPSRIPTSSRSTTLKGLLRSTISPTDKLIITQVLLDAEKELKNYQVEISRLRTAILTLESKQEGVKRMMDKYRSLLSPIHRVPPEVLKNIFEYSCRINHLNMGSLPPAMTLSAVCGRWRELVLNTPSLWSSISIDYLYWERGSCEFLNRLTCRFMERSRTSPLTLNLEFCAFDFNEADDDAISTVEALVHNCSRWYDVTWCFRRQAMNNSMFAPIRGHLPMLQYLDIRADEEGSDEDELSWGLFSECPSLHSVSLAIGNPLSDSIDLPWQRIMSLTIDAGAANPDDILRVLSICPSIRRLELPSIYGFTIEPTVVRPSQLESLSITAYKSEHLSLLPHLTTPRLSSIEICGGYLGRHFWGPDTWDECLFTSFLVASYHGHASITPTRALAQFAHSSPAGMYTYISADQPKEQHCDENFFESPHNGLRESGHNPSSPAHPPGTARRQQWLGAASFDGDAVLTMVSGPFACVVQRG